MANSNFIFTITPSFQKDSQSDVTTTKFKKAWSFTAGWEGSWDGEKKKFAIDDSVASYGITPLFLKEFVGHGKKGVPLPTKEYMATINNAKAAEIWYNSRWNWFKCESIESDAIALLVFDWAVRRPAPVADALAAITGLTGSVDKKLITDFGGNPKGLNDKAYYPSDAVIKAINEACKIDGKHNAQKIRVLYDKIIKTRIKKESNILEGVKRRLGCLLYGEWTVNENSFNDLPKNRKKEILDGFTEVRTKKGLKVQKQANLSADTEGSYGNYIAGAFALWIGYKWFKNRKKR